MKIVLIGFMGAGKSSIASVLSQKLGLEFVEMDDLTLQKSGRISINEIFAKDGESAFRQLEITAAKTLSDSKNIIISAGGGVVQYKPIMDLLKNNGRIIYLDTPFEVIEKRLAGDDTRPLFKNKENARKLYDTRKKMYEEYSDATVSTGNKSIEQVAEEIIKVVKL